MECKGEDRGVIGAAHRLLARESSLKVDSSCRSSKSMSLSVYTDMWRRDAGVVGTGVTIYSC